MYRATFLRALAAENLSVRTLQTYGEAVSRLEAFLVEQDFPLDPGRLTREHLTDWVNALLARHKPSTALNRYHGVYRFFEYLVEEELLKTSPMAKMKPPKVPEPEVPVISEQALTKLLAAASGRGFRNRRDRALLLALVDTGLRVSEMRSIKLEPEGDRDSHVDVDAGVFYVIGKGGRHRRVPLGKAARRALDSYLLERAGHARADSPYLWLGERGPIRESGIYQIVERRCELAGIPRVHPHQFRHTFAHQLQRQQMNESELMYLAGWSSRTMLHLYGSSAVAERAFDSHRRLSPADRLATGRS